jgi:hypothetical protein
MTTHSAVKNKWNHIYSPYMPSWTTLFALMTSVHYVTQYVITSSAALFSFRMRWGRPNVTWTKKLFSVATVYKLEYHPLSLVWWLPVKLTILQVPGSRLETAYPNVLVHCIRKVTLTVSVLNWLLSRTNSVVVSFCCCRQFNLDWTTAQVPVPTVRQAPQNSWAPHVAAQEGLSRSALTLCRGALLNSR